MDIWLGHTGLAIAFVMLSTIVLWFCIKIRGRIIVKIVLIPATLWYGLVLYYTAPNLMGWPTSQTIPDNSQILAYQVEKPVPKHNDPGAIYFWIRTISIPKSQPNLSRVWFNPVSIFNHNRKTDPRAFKLPYSKKMHKAILDAQRQMEVIPGALIKINRTESGKEYTDNGQSKAKLSFEIINPVTFLRK